MKLKFHIPLSDPQLVGTYTRGECFAHYTYRAATKGVCGALGFTSAVGCPRNGSVVAGVLLAVLYD